MEEPEGGWQLWDNDDDGDNHNNDYGDADNNVDDDDDDGDASWYGVEEPGAGWQLWVNDDDLLLDYIPETCMSSPRWSISFVFHETRINQN